MPYTYPGQSFHHTLKPLKGWYEDSGIDAAGRLTSDVDINSDGSPATRGLVVHAAELQTETDPYGGTTTGPQLYGFEMGWGPSVLGLPMILWTNPTDPDGENVGTPTGVDRVGTSSDIAEWVSVLPPLDGNNLVALVLSGAYELEDTEFDTAQTYLTGQALRAVTSNTNVNAGKLTNQRGTSAAFNSDGVVQYVCNSTTVSTWDSIIGFVSRGKYINSNKRNALAFYAYPVPGNR